MSGRLMIYCDGSCPKPFGVGGWAFLILEGDYISRSGWLHPATNQTMELSAALEALREMSRRKWFERSATIISDSQYLVKGMMEWREAWLEVNYAGIANSNWWKLLHAYQDAFTDLRFEWVKGHASSKWNKRVDELAGEAQRRGVVAIAK
jgi:ribonuclease HI